MRNNFGDTIKFLREDRKLTLDDLARKTGIGLTYLSKIEHNKTGNPTIETIEKLAKALEVDNNMKDELFRLAKQIPQELKENITGRKSLFDVYRSVKDLSDEELNEMVKEIQERKKRKGAEDNKK
jgi:transcriptional regulator with XRE-family HTH domain